jgi:hypothetical protein
MVIFGAQMIMRVSITKLISGLDKAEAHFGDIGMVHPMQLPLKARITQALILRVEVQT